MKFPIAWVLTGSLFALSLQGCSQVPSSSEAPKTHEDSQAAEAGHDSQDTVNFIKIGSLQFKLSPEIMKDGETHLDFFVQDSEGHHVQNVTGIFHITKPDGSKENIIINEESAESGPHYHGILKHTEYGEYQVVAELKIGNQKLNPRFSFERKE